jgi:hypothetical protein
VVENKNYKKKFDLFFGPFCTKSAKIRRNICPRALLFIWHLLSYTAEQSANWQYLAIFQMFRVAQLRLLPTLGRCKISKQY